jgi:hypothetical protein
MPQSRQGTKVFIAERTGLLNDYYFRLNRVKNKKVFDAET